MEIKGYQIGAGRALLCIPVMAKTKEEIIKEITVLAQSKVEMIEWRVDAFDDYENYNAVREVYEAVAPCLKKTIFLQAFRAQRMGGRTEVSEDLIADLGDLAAESGCVDLLDLEFFEEKRPAQRIRELHRKGMKIMASHHDFEETPKVEIMRMLLEQMRDGNADIVKLAVMPKQEKDVLNLLEVTDLFRKAHTDTPVIAISMGKMGMSSRICGESFGSAVTFGSCGMESSPGQLDGETMKIILHLIHERLEASEE